MTLILEKLRLLLWKIGQPLTKIPPSSNAAVSDLFIWRHTDEITTYFELLNLPYLLNFSAPHPSVTLVIFNCYGDILSEVNIDYSPNLRHRIKLRDYLPAACGTYGSFSIFHHPRNLSPDIYKSFIAERGFTSYKFASTPVHSFVHGNLDAIARLDDDSLSPLGGSSIRNRTYKLQFNLRITETYEFIIVNPSKSAQIIEFTVLNFSSNVIFSETINLASLACHIFRYTASDDDQLALFTSKLIMARPLVFRYQGNSIDVFHG